MFFPQKNPTISCESISCPGACECVIADRSLNSPRSAVRVKCLAQRHLEAIVEAVNCWEREVQHFFRILYSFPYPDFLSWHRKSACKDQDSWTGLSIRLYFKIQFSLKVLFFVSNPLSEDFWPGITEARLRKKYWCNTEHTDRNFIPTWR